MTTSAYIPVDREHVLQTLQEAQEKLANGGSELVLDFSAVQRIDPAAIRALEEMARVADEKTSPVALRGINVEIYKALKLARLTSRFSFEN